MKRKERKIPTVLVTGAEGMVGSYIAEFFTEDKYIRILAGKKDLDITNVAAVKRKIRKYKPDLVIHLAAKTNVDLCEQFPEEAFKVNFEGTKNIADMCKQVGSTLVYISSSAVFDGVKKGFTEEDIQNPVNVYGRSKHEGEKYIQQNLSKFYIVRAGWMIGGGKKEKKFISYIINQAKKDIDIKVVNDKFGTITYAKELIDFIKKLFENNFPYGIYHYGSKGICSRYDIAKKVLKIIKKDLRVIPVSSKEFASTFFAPRPQNEVIKTVKGKFPHTWRQSLTHYLRNEIV